MAENSELEKRICVVWNTERPFEDRPRKSSNFTLLGSEWNLQMIYKSNDHYYISLQPRNETEDLGKWISSYNFPCKKYENGERSWWFYVTMFIEDKYFRETFKLKDITIMVGKDRVIICEFSGKDLSKNIEYFNNYGEWRILCLFHDFQPSAIQMKNETIHISTQTDLISNVDSLSLDLSNLLEKETFPDVTIRCGNRTISAHRSILAARSEVFEAMFRNKMVEGETGVVDVTDLDAPVLDMLLKYAYAGKITDLSEDMAASLYRAGDKYAIYPLKKACADWMITNLTEENCIGFLTTADVHSDSAFKDEVVSFICGHETLLESEDWLVFSGEHSKLAVEVYQRVFRVKRGKV